MSITVIVQPAFLFAINVDKNFSSCYKSNRPFTIHHSPLTLLYPIFLLIFFIQFFVFIIKVQPSALYIGIGNYAAFHV